MDEKKCRCVKHTARTTDAVLVKQDRVCCTIVEIHIYRAKALCEDKYDDVSKRECR